MIYKVYTEYTRLVYHDDDGDDTILRDLMDGSYDSNIFYESDAKYFLNKSDAKKYLVERVKEEFIKDFNESLYNHCINKLNMINYVEFKDSFIMSQSDDLHIRFNLLSGYEYNGGKYPKTDKAYDILVSITDEVINNLKNQNVIVNDDIHYSDDIKLIDENDGLYFKQNNNLIEPIKSSDKYYKNYQELFEMAKVNHKIYSMSINCKTYRVQLYMLSKEQKSEWDNNYKSFFEKNVIITEVDIDIVDKLLKENENLIKENNELTHKIYKPILKIIDS